MAKQHSERPAVLRKGKDWMCKCQVINLYEQSVCKMIAVEATQLAERRLKASQPSSRKTAKEYQIERERKREEGFQGLNPYEAILKREL